MKFNRRYFVKSSLGAGILATTQGCLSAAATHKTTIAQLDKAAAAPVLKLQSVKSPVKIASVDAEMIKAQTAIMNRTLFISFASSRPTVKIGHNEP
ncbi:MAG: hypothetical protein KAY65_00595 [Planctomycetes bacterium]|nr:hypothetical protein [Planctomycetota bacterium]